MEAAISKAQSLQDEAILKCIETVIWLAEENLPLTKYECMFRLFSKLDVKGLEGSSVSERVNCRSYYMANKILDSISTIIDIDTNVKIQKSEFISVLADESTDKANKKE